LLEGRSCGLLRFDRHAASHIMTGEPIATPP
jgi:hypothetical protein